jgi:hypothetical protein
MTDYATMGDAAFPQGLDGTDFNAVAGYLPAVNALHGWTDSDWRRIPGPKLPIWVAAFGNKSGLRDAEATLTDLLRLGVPKGKIVALDMETSVDRTYVAAYGAVLQHNGYKVWVYGAASTVFDNPQLNGYWVADYAGIGPFMYRHPGTRATQWTDGAKYDQSTVKPWVLADFWV